MPLIDGIGDEVVQFAVAVLVTFVAGLAWWSTNARPDRYRTVLVMRSRANLPVTFSIRTRSNFMMSNIQASTVQVSTPDTVATSSTETPVESEREGARVIPLQEMDSIVDADMAMLENQRLHFYRRVDGPANIQNASDSSEDMESQDEGEPSSNEQIREMDSIVSAMEADVTTGCDLFTRAGEPVESVTEKQTEKVDDKADNLATSGDTSVDSSDVTTRDTSVADARILIRLKYLNDTLKEVDASLDELLKDFKWRHFSAELSAALRVRLIFSGRVLSDERATLRACGLRHGAVVHCLVHPRRAPAQQHAITEEGADPAGNETLSEANPRERPWDLENILLTLVSVALTVVWFFRCEYSNMFTASASVALFGLTVFYSVAIFGLYLSDTFHFDRRPAQPVPPN